MEQPTLKHTFSIRILNNPTLAGVAVFLIFPHDIASSGLAPESLPSNSEAVLINTLKSAPFLC